MKQASSDQKVQKVSASNTTINTIVREGGSEQVIYRLVEGFGVSLVVMGTSGGKNFAKKVFGTTTEAVAMRGLCPVLVIPENGRLLDLSPEVKEEAENMS